MAFRPSIGGPFWWNAGILAGPSGRFGGVKQQEVIPEGSLAEYVEVGEIIGTLLLYRYCYVDLYLYIYIYTQIFCYLILRYVYIYTDIVLLDIALYIYIYTDITVWYYDSSPKNILENTWDSLMQNGSASVLWYWKDPPWIVYLFSFQTLTLDHYKTFELRICKIFALVYQVHTVLFSCP